MKEIVNRKAKFDYHFVREYEAGIQLTGTEVKSIKAGNVSMKDSYCLFKGHELFVLSLFIAEYSHGNINNHETRRQRKLLLKKSELKKLKKRVDEKGYAVVPYKMYLSERGIIKMQIVLGQGKKSFDKSNAIRDRDLKRDLDRSLKEIG